MKSFLLKFAVAGGVFLSASQLWAQAPATLNQSVTYNGETVTLQMTRQDLRGSYFELWAQNGTGGYDVIVPTAERSYLGTVAEYPGAVVGGIRQDDGVFRGAVYFDRGGTWFTLGTNVTGTRGLSQPTSFGLPSLTLTPGQAGSTTYGFDVAIDADYNYYSVRGGSSTAKTFELIEFGVTATRALYLRDALLRPHLGRIIIRASQAQDPTEGLTAGDYLSALRTEWNSNHTDTTNDVVAGVTTSKVGGGLGYVGVIGTSSRFSVNDSDADGNFSTVWRHEMGHNWGLGHYDGGAPEGRTINSGNTFARMSGPEVEKVLTQRDAKLALLSAEGVYTNVNLPPYACIDSGVVNRASGATNVTLNVLHNDHDANGHALTGIVSFDPVTSNGGTVAQIGSGASAQLVYSPEESFISLDWFKYTIQDSSGQMATGVAVVQVTWGLTLVYEGFDAAAGDVITNHTTGLGWNGPWSGTFNNVSGFSVSSNSVSFAALPVTARSISNGASNSVTYVRSLAQPIQVGGAGGQTEWWLSALISLAGTNPGQGVEVGLGNSGLVMGKEINGSLGFKSGGTWHTATNSTGANNGNTPTGTYLCVVQMLATNGNTLVRLYLDKNTAIDLSNPANFAYQTALVVPGSLSFNSLSLFVNKSDPQNVDFDELRMARTYAQVVPVAMTNPPVFTANPLAKAAARISEPYLQDLTGDVTDADAADVHYFTKVAGPAWLVLDASGKLLGTPAITDAGTNTFTVRVTDAAGNYNETQLKIPVTTPALFLNDPVMRIAKAGVLYNGTLSGEATNTTGGSMTYSKVSGPAWLAVASNGALSGTPGVADMGLNSFVVQATNSLGGAATANLWVEVPSDALLAYEHFSGTAGANVSGSTGGQGWGAAWSGDTAWDFATPGTTFPGLVSIGLKSIVGGQGTTITRSMAQSLTVGTGAGERPEIWVTSLMDINTVTGVGHAVQVKLLNGATQVGMFGKAINESLGFDVGGSGFQSFSGSLGTGTGTEGKWFFALKLRAQSGGTQITLYLTKDAELFDPLVDILDPAYFAHVATTTVAGKVTFNTVGMYRWNNTSSFIDEIRVGLSYEANIGRAGSTNPPPSIVSPPQSLAVNLGDPAVFSVTASGAAPLKYQWKKNGTAIPGATNTTYSIASVVLNDLAGYTVTVSNSVGTVTSAVASLSLDVPPGGAFLNVNAVTNQLSLSFAGQPALAYDVERSPNLTAWATVATNLIAPSSGLMNYIEYPATNPAAFYRLRLH